MRIIELKVFNYSELSAKAKKIAKEELKYLLDDILSFYCKEINESLKAFLNALDNKSTFNMNKDDYPLTGVCYDYDFLALLDNKEGEECYSVQAKKLAMKLKRDERKYLYSNESINDLCIGNDIEFLESGKVYID